VDLRSIHLPEPVSVGWSTQSLWALASLVVIVSVILAVRCLRRRRDPVWLALAELKDIRATFKERRDARAAVAQASALVRRFAIARWPERDIAGLTGEHWFEFLQEVTRERTLYKRLVAALGELSYQPSHRIDDVSCTELLDAVGQWLSSPLVGLAGVAE
jgi:hypothetical protein